MPLEEWSEEITIASVGDEPAFSEDMANLLQKLDERGDGCPDVVLDLTAVSYLNSSNIAQMLRLRKRLNTAGRQMRICSVEDQVWGQVENQVGRQVRNQVRGQVRNQVVNQVEDQVENQVVYQVWSQVYQEARDQVRDQVVDQVREDDHEKH